MATFVHPQSDPDRYEITADQEVAGFTEFLDLDGQRVFFHTEIDDDFGGRGLGTILVGEALAATRPSGRRIVPVCEFVAKYLDKHPEYADIVDPVTPEVEAAVRERSQRSGG